MKQQRSKRSSAKPWLIAQLAVLTLLAVYGVSAGADSVQVCVQAMGALCGR